MTDFTKLLSLILEKKPTRLIVNPSNESLVASFDIAKKIQLYDYKKIITFKEKVINELENFPISFGSFCFDIQNKKKSEEWKNFPLIEFIFPDYAIKFENNKFISFGENIELSHEEFGYILSRGGVKLRIYILWLSYVVVRRV